LLSLSDVLPKGDWPVDSYVPVTTIETVEEAQHLATILKEREIPYEIHPFHTLVNREALQAQKGWGLVSAPEEYQKMVLYVISDLRKDASLA
jgi:uncharacterized protein YqgV (UPF0045/DUF77 family)